MIDNKKLSRGLASFLPLAAGLFFAATCLLASPGEVSKDRGFLEETPLTQSSMGQALINSDPKNPEGYRLLAASQNADSKWMDLLRTVDKAERNNVSDSFLYHQKAMVFLALQDFEQNYYALVMAEKLARQNDK